MKVLSHILLMTIATCVLACNSRNTQTPDKLSDDSTGVAKAKDSMPKQEKETIADTVINLNFSSGATQEAKGRLGKRGPDISCNFTISKPASLNATIIPDKNGCNIRFNQIISPGEKADGPFGAELKYKLQTKGRYRVIIGHNMMAGDPEVCDFTLRIRLQ
jgi:hypothetical protein